MNNYSGLWKGYYTHHTGPKAAAGTQIPFSIKLTDNHGTLTGTVHEEYSHYVTDKPITVKGFVDFNFVSIIKEYPYSFTSDDSGKLIINNTKPHHPIHYQGALDSVQNIISGNWEMNIVKHRRLYGNIGTRTTGYWEMRKVY